MSAVSAADLAAFQQGSRELMRSICPTATDLTDEGLDEDDGSFLEWCMFHVTPTESFRRVREPSQTPTEVAQDAHFGLFCGNATSQMLVEDLEAIDTRAALVASSIPRMHAARLFDGLGALLRHATGEDVLNSTTLSRVVSRVAKSPQGQKLLTMIMQRKNMLVAADAAAWASREE